MWVMNSFFWGGRGRNGTDFYIIGILELNYAEFFSFRDWVREG